jgi:RHS repeat-associated protein
MRARFLVRGIGGVLAFAPGELALALRTPTRKRDSAAGSRDPRRPPPDRVPPTTVRKRWIGASPTAELTGTLHLPGRANFLIGNDPAKWHINLPTYAGIVTRQLYPGIDLHEQGIDGMLKGTYVVAPGADPKQIRWRYQGADSVSVDATGKLVVSLPAPASTLTDTEALSSTLTELAPVAWQTINERDVAVPVRFNVDPGGIVRFELGAYDMTQPLTIDPVLTYSTYLAGTGNDYGYGIAVDSAGNSYVTGSTASATFPADGLIQGTNAGGNDVFVSKLNAAGSALIYSTLLGGTGNDEGYDIAVDSAGNAYITGSTYSSGFPTVNPLSGQGSYHNGVDAFVAKLNAAGSGLIYSTYLGDSADEYSNGIAVDSSGNAYVTGDTQSPNFPTTPGARQTVKDLGYDAFVTKLVWNGTTLSYGYSTFLGGNVNDHGRGVVVDGLGNAYVVGDTTSTVFPTVNPRQSACGDTAPSCWDAFVTKLNSSGSAYIYSTYLGGNYSESAWSIAIDVSGSAYVTGETASTNFPTTLGAFQPTDLIGTDAYVTKLVWNGTTLSYGYSTYLGGSGTDDGDGIAVDSAGNAFITGATTSTDFPTRSPLQSANGGGTDAFVTWLNATGAMLMYSTYLGGSSIERGFEIAGDSVGNVYLTGLTQSSNFPTVNPVQGTARGGSEAFVSKFNLGQRVNQYTYEGLQRLIGANETSSAVYTYTCDLAGNRTAVQLNGGTPATTTYNAANQITNAGFSYDNAGNLLNDGTAAYTYDALGRTTVRGTTTYGYNGDGTLVSQLTSGVTTRYTQDLAAPLSQVLQTQVGAAARTDYLYGLNRLASLNGSVKTWYAADALGSVRRIVTDAGTPLGIVNYDPWGTPEAGTVPTFGFTGEVQDVGAGLVNLRARWYSTNQGRFNTVDPFAGVAETPYSQHQYQYGYSDPVLNTDPSGQVVPVCPIGYRKVIKDGQFAGCEDDPDFPSWLGFLKGSMGLMPVGGVALGGTLPQAGGQVAGKPLETCVTFLVYLFGQFVQVNTRVNTQARRNDPKPDIAYRNPAIGEHPTALTVGFFPKNDKAPYSLGTHVRQGSRLATKYISLTRSLAVARSYQDPNVPIYVIDLKKVQGVVIDLSIPSVRESMIPNDAIARSYAAASQEVVVVGWVPPTAIVATIDFMQSFIP